MAKGKKQKLSFAANVLTIAYPSIGKKFVVDAEKYPASIFLACESARHGLKQKFGDAASGESPAEKYAMVQRIHAGLLAGDWELEAGPQDLTPIICEALARIKKVPLADVKISAAKAGAEKVKEWGTNAKVRAEILKIRAERAEAAAEDSDEEIDIEV